MTNFDAISARLYPYNVDDNLIAIACMDAGLGTDDEYTAANKAVAARAAIDVLKQLIILSSESNGGYSIGYNTDELRLRIHDMARDNGLTDIADEFNGAPAIEFLPY